MASRSTNTFAEALERLLGDLAQMKLLPDADDELIGAMEEAIIGWYREPIDNAMAAGTTSVQSSPADIPPEMMGGMGGMGGGVGASQIAGGGGAGRGMPPGAVGAGAPNPDELRRLMGGAGGLI